MTTEVTVPVRTILSLPRDEDGLFIQPDELTPEFAIVIEHNRERMANKWDYADEWTGNARTVDPNKSYNCGGCNQAEGDVCLAVYDDSDADAEDEPSLVVNLDYGSCGKFEIICAGDPELRANRLPASVANYGIRKDGSPGHVFGCQECPFAKETKWPDSRNRRFWCGKGASTVQDGACCTINGAPTVEESTSEERSVSLKRSAQPRTIRKVIPLKIAEVEGNPNRSRFIAATSQLARDGHVLEPGGMEIENFLGCGTILFDHDPKVPIGAPAAASLNSDGNLEIEVEWAPSGISEDADKIRGLVKAGVLRSGSVGFDVLDAEPLDPKKPRGGLHITRSELLEFSVVSVPADTGAVVTQRSAEDWKCGVSRDLPIEDSDEWDGSAAEESIFAWAGGDDFDPSKARKGFLAYNAAKPKERGSYKLPIAHVTSGRLKVPKGAIRAAASRLPQADIPDTVKESARKALDHYEEKAGMSDKDKGGDRAVVVKHRRALRRAPKLPIFKRGLYDVAALASILGQVGYATDCAEWEAEIEEDDSQVPAMLGEALKQLGEALIAMTAEEVQELLDMHSEDDGTRAVRSKNDEEDDDEKDDEDDDEGDDEDDGDENDEDDEDDDEDGKGKSDRSRAWRRAVALTRAGKAISAANAEKLQQAQEHQERALGYHRALGEQQSAVTEHMDDIGSAHKRAVKAHGELGEALEAVKNEPAKATEHVARAIKAHEAMDGHHQDMADAYQGAADRHQDAVGASASLGRSIRAAQRSVRAVVEGSAPGAEAEDGDSKDVQTSAGTEQSDGSTSGRSYRQRQKDIQELAAIGRSYN